jgi:hypothetical protein
MRSNEDLGHTPEQHCFTRRSGSRRRVVIAGAALAAAFTTSLGVLGASAVTPVAPHNITVFPDRDFVSAEGYAPGTPVTITAKGVSTTVVADAAGLAEVNHPGGGCWPAGATPDIVPGDLVTATPDGGVTEDTVVKDTYVTSNAQALSTTVVSVTGYVGPTVNKTQMEQRIVDPRFTNLVGRRDIRAVPGPRTLSNFVSSSKAQYYSQLTFPTADSFEAKYEFTGTNATNAASVAANASLGERVLAWDVNPNQGITIAEYGEIGGAILECGGTATAPLPTGIQDVRITWKSGSLRVRGTTPAVGQVVSLHLGSATGTILGRDTTIAAVAPHTGGDFDIKVTGPSVAQKPSELWLTADDLVDGPLVIG